MHECRKRSYGISAKKHEIIHFSVISELGAACSLLAHSQAHCLHPFQVYFLETRHVALEFNLNLFEFILNYASGVA